MKNIFLLILLLLFFLEVNAQVNVEIKGKVINSSEDIRLRSEGILRLLNLDENGEFNVTLTVESLPTYFSIATLSGRGKISNQIPTIWVDEKQFVIEIDLAKKSYKTDQKTKYQDLSEKIENANIKTQLALISESPNQPPAMYFLEKNKEKVSSEFLGAYLNKLNSASKYAQYIQHYDSAKQLNSVGVNSIIKNFPLKNKNLEYEDVIVKNGKKKLIGLMSSSCYFSMSSIPFLVQVHANGHEKLDVITIWDDVSYEIWQNRNPELKAKITWKNLWDEYEFAVNYFNRTLTPTFFIVDENGKIEKKLTGFDNKTMKHIKTLVD